MIKLFKRNAFLYCLLFASQSIFSQNCDIDDNIVLSNANTQGFCAPVTYNFPLEVPNNDMSTEYIFILHDVNEPYTFTDTITYTQETVPDQISYEFENSTCDINGAQIVIDIYIKNINCEVPFNNELGSYVSTISQITVDGPPTADFSYTSDCNTFTFTNETTSGEVVIDGACEQQESNIYWIIDSAASNYTIIDGQLGNEFSSTNHGSESLTVQFNNIGTFNVTLFTKACNPASSSVQSICVENYQVNLDEFEFQFPNDSECVDEVITLGSNIESIFICEELTYEWQIISDSIACQFSSDIIDTISPFTGPEPSFRFLNPGFYQIQFSSTSDCISPPLDTIHSITVYGFPQIQDLTSSQICNTLITDIAIDFDSCLSSDESYVSSWNILNDDSDVFSGNSQLNTNQANFDSSGIYILEYSLGNECGFDTESFEIDVIDTLVLDMDDTVSVCIGQDYLITPQISGGAPEYSYEWNVLNEFGSELTLENIQTSIQVTLKVSDQNNCVVEDSIYIEVRLLPDFSMDSLYTKCEGDTLTILPDYSNLEDGIDDYTFLWQDVDTGSNFFYDEDIDTLIYLVVTDNIGCTSIDSSFIEVLSFEDYEFSDSLRFCKDDEIQLPIIEHLDTENEGVWFGSNIFEDSGLYFFNDLSSTSSENEVYYSIENESGCQNIDTALLIISTNPNIGLSTYDICAPEDALIIFSPATLNNSPSTISTIEIFAGDNNLIIDTTFTQSELPDSLFFQLPSTSCDFIYTDSIFDNGYLVYASSVNECDSDPSVFSGRIFASESPTSLFEINNPDSCHVDSIYRFTNQSLGINNDNGVCSKLNLQWELLNGIEGADWNIIDGQFGDSLTGGSDTLNVKFMNPGTYNIKLTSTSCSSDDTIQTIIIDPIPALEIVADSLNFCDPDAAYFSLSSATYLNPITTRYIVRVYQGDGVLIETQNFTQLSLPQDSVIVLDSISSSSCNLQYNDAYFDGSYKIDVEAINKCDTSSLVSLRAYYSDPALVDFDIDNSSSCADSTITFINKSLEGEINVAGQCDRPYTKWSLNNGLQGEDWLIISGQMGDSISSGSDSLVIKFINAGSYDINLSVSSCSQQDLTKSIDFFPTPNLDLLSTNFNSCGPNLVSFELSSETYANFNETSYNIMIYRGEGVLLDSIHYTQSTLPQGLIYLSEINSSSCDLTYDDSSFDGSYKIYIEAIGQCDSVLRVSRAYFNDPPISNFSIDSSEVCGNRVYKFTNETISLNNEFGVCSPAHFNWQLSGEYGVDWDILSSNGLGDSITSGAEILEIQFLNPNIYDLRLISNTCSSDTLLKSFCVNTKLYDFITNNQPISIPNTACIGASFGVENNISATQSCGINYQWVVEQENSFCSENSDSSFSISNASSSVPIIYFNNPGDYSVSCQIINDCGDSITLSETVNVLKTPQFTSSQINSLDICNSNHISLQLSLDTCSDALSSHAWQVDSSSNILSENAASIEVIFAEYGQNIIQYTIQNSCGIADSSFTYLTSAPEIVSFGPDLEFCIEQNSPQVLENPYNGEWSGTSLIDTLSDGSGTYVFYPNFVGTYPITYSYTDDNGCFKQESLNVIVQSDPQIEALVSGTGCVDEEISWTVTPNSSVITSFSEELSITSGIPFGSISANSAGEFYVYFEYGSGICYSTDSMLFSVDGPKFSINSDSVLCSGDTTQLSYNIISVDQTNGPLQSAYWSENGVPISDVNSITSVINTTPNISSTYSCTMTDANGCQTTESIFLSVSCTENDFEDFDAVSVYNETEVLFPNISSYSNILYEGCTGAKITINKPDCVPNDIPVFYKIRGNASENDFYFDPPGELIIPADSSSITLEIFPINDNQTEIPDTLRFIFDQIRYSDCFINDSLSVEFLILDQPNLDLDITSDFSIYCPGDEAVVEVTAIGGVGAEMISQQSTSELEPYIYDWSHIGSAAVQILNPIDTTTFCVNVTDVCGISRDTCVTVSVSRADDDTLVAYINSTYVCEDTLGQICVITQGGEGNFTYSWSNGSTDNCIEDFYQTAPYTVTVTDFCNAEAQASGYILDGTRLNPDFSYISVPHINLGIEFYNYSDNLTDNIYSWDFGDGSFPTYNDQVHPIHTYTEPGTYNVTLTTSSPQYEDCVSQISSFVEVDPTFGLWVPNSFTPNNDGKNDLFKPIITGSDYYEVSILDKWGGLVFYSKNIDEYWDGTVDGKICQIGMYKCKVIYSKSNDIMNLSRYFNVNLIR